MEKRQIFGYNDLKANLIYGIVFFPYLLLVAVRKMPVKYERDRERDRESERERERGRGMREIKEKTDRETEISRQRDI